MKKKVISCILFIAMIITSFVSCGDVGEQADNGNKEIVLTGEMAPVASFFDVNLPFYDMNIDFVWQGDDFVYMEKEWDKDARRNICTLSRVPADGSGEAVQIYQTTAEEPSIWNFTMDDEGNFYTQSWVPVMDSDPLVKQFTMCKYDANMQEILSVEPKEVTASELNAVHYMYVDSAGHVILADYECNVYFFDENLNFVWKDQLPNNFTEPNFIDAGEQGSFFAEYDYMTCRVFLLKIDYEKQSLTAIPDINMSDYLEEYDTLKVVSGKEYGILLSGEDAMWKYNVDTGEVEEWFDWKDSNMNVYGDTIKEVKFHEEVEGEPFMSVWCYDGFTRGNSEMAEISYVDKAYLPEKQTVVLGTLVYSDVSQWVSKFNRNNREYEVVVKTYEDSDELVQSFLFGQDEIPDILDISVTSSAMLENKGILEDLEPYFKNSDVVNKDDILEQIWDMCKTDGKVTSMMTCFSFQSCVTTAESISEGGWTIDEFFALEEQYPESKPLLNYNYGVVMRTLGDMGVESFIDWNKKKCDFDSKEFIELIENIKSLDIGNSEIIYLDEQEEIDSLLAKDYLLRWDSYNSPYWYRRVQNKYRGSIKNVGFPTTDGEPYYRVYPTLQFSIYTGSEKKDGAWAFIEFMLSEESQTWYGNDVWAFPVRQEEYEEFLTKPHSAVINYADDDESIDTYTVFMDMIEHSHLRNSSSLGTITTIVNEELQAYFENAKSAEDTAKIIQSRVQLYLDENY